MSDENTGGEDTSSSETNDVDFLASGENKAPSETEDKVETQEEKEEETESGSADFEDSEDEAEDSGEEKEKESELTEEEKEIESKITRPSWEKIKSKYPEAAKDRELREIYFRDQQFSELFPSLNEAKESAEKARLFDFFDSGLANGDPKVLIDALDKKVLENFSESILDSLYAHDKSLFVRATGPYLSNVLNSIYAFAESKSDKNLTTSVLNICKHLFGEFKLPNKPVNRNHPELEGERKALREERERLFTTQRRDFQVKAEKIIGSRLDKIIREDLNVKNEYLATSIVKDTIEKLKQTLEQDQNFLNSMKNLFIQAEKGGYNSDHQARVISAYLGRAKGIALKLRAEVRASAIGKPSSNNADDKPKRVEGRDKGSREPNKGDNKSKDLKNTGKFSDLDILNMP